MNNRTPNNEDISISDFDWFLPSPKKVVYAIAIPNDTCFNLNQRLTQKLPKMITIGINSDAKTLCIKKEPDKGFSVPKSGTIKDNVLINTIKSRGIRLPAHYSAESKGEYWIASLVPPISSPILPKKTPSKPRTNGLNAMLTSGGNV
jgi:hypothetical protein